jgi:histidinol-phosphate/aromatic aminotransferase/cobyric acid decarboxylase-like protein
LGLDPANLLDLSASLNPLAPSAEAVVDAMSADSISNYPDAQDATALLAEAIGVAADQLLLTNGGAEAIALVAAEHPVGLVEEPAFSLYRRHLVQADDPAGLLWRANPSSPLGELAEPTATADVWDEAYWALATGTWTRGDDAAYRLGSLTKLWACPGLRLGYVIAPDADAAARLAERQPRWAVNAPALAAVPVYLERSDLPGWRDGIAALRRDLAAVWRTAGFRVTEPVANWILVDDAAPLRLPLARAGILVRDCGSFGLPGVARVAVPDELGLQAVRRALTQVVR